MILQGYDSEYAPRWRKEVEFHFQRTSVYSSHPQNEGAWRFPPPGLLLTIVSRRLGGPAPDIFLVNYT